MKRFIKKDLIFVFLAIVGACYPFLVIAEEGGQYNQPVISRIVIDVNGTKETANHYENIASSLIRIQEGELFSFEKLERSIALLKSSRMFKVIDVSDPDPEESEIILQFKLTPFTRIKNIKIKGGFPVLKRKILNVMTIYTGETFDPDKLSLQEEKIEKIFADNGYISPKVTTTSLQDSLDGNHEITVDIDKGDYYIIKNIEINGNKSFSDTRLELRLDEWKTFIPWYEIRKFIRKKVNEQLKDLTEFYRRNGYADILIKLETDIVPGNREVSLRVDIDEGPRYDIKFEGNHFFWDYTLKKDLVLKSRGNLNDLGLKRSIRNIRDRYRKSGYADARVSMVEETLGEAEVAERKIIIRIDEGIRSLVKLVEITGATAFKHRQIKKQMITRDSGFFADGEYVPDVLEEDMMAIQAFYFQNGYMNAIVEDQLEWEESKKKDVRYGDLMISVNEGVQTLVNEVVFRGLSVLKVSDIADDLVLRKGEPFTNEKLSQDDNRIFALISEAGYPHARVTGAVQVDSEGSKARVIFEIEEGPFVTMGEVFCTGNFRTKEKIITNEVDIASGESFSLLRILESQRDIRNINSLDSANFRLAGLKEKEDKVHLLVTAAEKKPYYYQLGVGYDTRRKFYANTRVGDHNLLGLNKDAWANVEFSQIGHREDVSIMEPRFLGSRISSTLNMYAEELEEFNKDFGTRTYGVSLIFNRKFLEKFNAALSFRYEKRHQYQTEPEAVIVYSDDQEDKRNVLTTSPSIIFNSTDSFVNPTKGLFASFFIDISKGIKSDSDDFLKHRLELRYFYTPINRLTFAMRGRYGYIEPGKSNTFIYEDHLFFLGGTSDVRGFDENMLRYDQNGNPVGGRSEVLGSLEARYNMFKNLDITLFFDVGSVRYVYGDDDNDGLRPSAGAGLRYITPIGPLGFLYGAKLDPRDGEPSGELHFTIGHTF